MIEPDPHAQASGALDRLSGLVEELKLEPLRRQVAACRRQFQADGSVEVAVFGRFKAGKSSFLNHLAGREVLPVGVVPLTAVITRLRFGPVERAEVRFEQGAVRAIPLADIPLYVAERENPGNRKQVSAVEVELPALRALAPITFLDTPGLGSALAHNTQAALEWLPNAGAALVAVSADAPLSERDVALIEQLRNHTPRIAILLTKADLLTDAQRAEVRQFVLHELRRHWAAEFPLFFGSVKPGLEPLRAELIEKLLRPLAEHHAQAGSDILRHKLLSLAGQVLGYLRVGLAAAEQADSARNALAERLRAEQRESELLRAEFSVLAHQWSAAALEASLERLQPIQADLAARAVAELAGRFPEWHQPLPALLADWRAWLQALLRRELEETSRNQRAMFCEPLGRAKRHLARMLQAFHDRLNGHVQAGLGVSLTRAEIGLEAPAPASPPVDVGYAFDEAFSLAGRLLPARALRRPIRRALARKTRWEVEKNLSRLAAAWQDRVAAGITALVGQAESHAALDLAGLEQMITQARSSEPRLRQLLAEVTAIRDTLQGCDGATGDLRG